MPSTLLRDRRRAAALDVLYGAASGDRQNPSIGSLAVCATLWQSVVAVGAVAGQPRRAVLVGLAGDTTRGRTFARGRRGRGVADDDPGRATVVRLSRGGRTCLADMRQKGTGRLHSTISRREPRPRSQYRSGRETP